MKYKAQEYLEQVEKLNAMIENKRVEAQQWRDLALNITAKSDGERVQSSGSKRKMADALDRAADLEAEANKIRSEMIEQKQEIIRTIEKLNASQYDVLHKVYIQGKSFKEVAAAKGKSVSWATSIHGLALQSLQKILDRRGL